MGGDDIVVEEKVGLSFWKGNKRHTKEQNMREREREREREEKRREGERRKEGRREQS
jgi:hypothetical protein